MVKMNDFDSSHFGSSGSGQFYMFLTYVIKVDKREAVRLYFYHIHVLLSFLVFPGKFLLYGESE